MSSEPDLAAQLAEAKLANARSRAQIAALEYQLNASRALLEASNPELAAQDGSGTLTYLSDSLATWDKSVTFLTDPRFAAAYQRGMQSGHQFGAAQPHWRVAISCWAAWHAAQLPGDFVECGTNTGITSLAVCEYVDFNRIGKSFWLFDTFGGIPREQMSVNEAATRESGDTGIYPECFELAQRNFAPYPKVRLVRGKVPDTLSSVEIDQVCYLAIDMNIEYPERAALAHFWPKIVPGGIVVFDDYGWLVHRAQKDSHDAFAKSQGVEIFTLPTGQGLLLKR